jgi:hypothetical protein
MVDVPELTNEQLVLALAVCAGLAFLSFLFGLVALARLRKARREYMILRGDGAERDILSMVDKTHKRVASFTERMDSLTARQEEQAAISRFAVRRFDLVRYDAFAEMGGEMSFSAALLDDHGDGFVLTSINGRSEARTYAKPVKALSSDHDLTEEEREAITGAAAGRGRGESRSKVSR